MRIGENFVRVSSEYLDYLRENYDSKVQNDSYDNYDKFSFGIITLINNFRYYVPVSSFSEQQRTNLLIKDNNNNTISSLRFCFMIPVPQKINGLIETLDISMRDNKYINMVDIEEKFCLANIETINHLSQLVYKKSRTNPQIKSNCCDFKKLEEGCKQWAFNHMLITNRDELLKNNIYYSGDNFNPQNVVNIVNGTYSRCEGFDNTKPELQEITIYAKDEFGQEKSTQLFVKVTPPNSGDNNNISIEKEAVGV